VTSLQALTHSSVSTLLAATKTRGDTLRFLWVLDMDARLMWAMAVDRAEGVYKSIASVSAEVLVTLAPRGIYTGDGSSLSLQRLKYVL